MRRWTDERPRRAVPPLFENARAAWSEPTKLTFEDYGDVFSSLNSAKGARSAAVAVRGAAQKVEIEARPIDALLAEADVRNVTLAKIDAESSELEVLKGMEGLLERCAPALIIEMASLDAEMLAQSEAVAGWLAERGYKGWRWDGDNLAEAGPLAEIAYDNILFLKG